MNTQPSCTRQKRIAAWEELIARWESAATPILIHYLRERPNKGIPISEYALRVRIGGAGRYTFSTHRQDDLRIFWDTRQGLALMHEDRAIAAVGFYISSTNGFCVKQIQGVHGQPNATQLQRFEWPTLLLDAVCAIARSQNARFVSVRCGEKNQWLKGHSSGPAMQKRFIQRYNQTAEVLGFTFHPSTSSYRLYLDV